jgi:hypothetical protein
VSGTGYKLLGFSVWHGGKWYLRRRYRWLFPSRRVAAAGVVAAAIAVLVVVGARRELSDAR